MKYVFYVLAIMMVVGCGDEHGRRPKRKAPATTTPVVDLEQEAIDELLEEENDYRLTQGHTVLSQGLSCTLYKFGTVALPLYPTSIASATGLRSVATFLLNKPVVQEESSTSVGLSILPDYVREYHLDWYLLRCQGWMVATETDYYDFEMSSDDGGTLYVGGSLLIDNDGMHPTTTKTGYKFLRRGVHQFRFDFLQGSGDQSLSIKMNDSLMHSKFMVH